MSTESAGDNTDRTDGRLVSGSAEALDPVSQLSATDLFKLDAAVLDVHYVGGRLAVYTENGLAGHTNVRSLRVVYDIVENSPHTYARRPGLVLNDVLASVAAQSKSLEHSPIALARMGQRSLRAAKRRILQVQRAEQADARKAERLTYEHRPMLGRRLGFVAMAAVVVVGAVLSTNTRQAPDAVPEVPVRLMPQAPTPSFTWPNGNNPFLPLPTKPPAPSETTLPPPVPPAEQAPKTDVPPPPKTEQKPRLKPDYSAETLWAMFANVVGKNQAGAEIDKRIDLLEAKGFRFTFHTDPKNPNLWWVITVKGPDGTKFHSNSQVASLLASV